jgi:nicotinamidase-related amidase
MKDVLVAIDVLNDFEHEDGERLVGSFRERVPALREAIDSARASGVPVVYVNDHHGDWSADRGEMVERARRGRSTHASSASR